MKSIANQNSVIKLFGVNLCRATTLCCSAPSARAATTLRRRTRRRRRSGLSFESSAAAAVATGRTRKLSRKDEGGRMKRRQRALLSSFILPPSSFFTEGYSVNGQHVGLQNRKSEFESWYPCSPGREVWKEVTSGVEEEGRSDDCERSEERRVGKECR